MPAVSFGAMAMFAWQRWLPRLLAVVVTLASSACRGADAKPGRLARLFGDGVCDDGAASFLGKFAIFSILAAVGAAAAAGRFAGGGGGGGGGGATSARAGDEYLCNARR